MNKGKGEMSEEEKQKEERRKQMMVENAKRRRERERKLQHLNKQIKQKEQQALKKHRQSKQKVYKTYLRSNSRENTRREKSVSKDNIVTRNEEKPEKMKENANPNTNIQTKTDLKKQNKKIQVNQMLKQVEKDINQVRNIIGYSSDEQDNVFFAQTNQNTMMNWANQDDDSTYKTHKHSKTVKELDFKSSGKKIVKKEEKKEEIISIESNTKAEGVEEKKPKNEDKNSNRKNITRIRKVNRSRSKQIIRNVGKEEQVKDIVRKPPIPINSQQVNEQIIKINTKQRKLQQEIRNIHVLNKQKIKSVQEKYEIKTNYKHSQNLINCEEQEQSSSKANVNGNVSVKQSEKQIENSIQRLDGMLSTKQQYLQKRQNQDEELLQNSQCPSIIDPFSNPAQFQKQILRLAQNISKQTQSKKNMFESQTEQGYDEFEDSLQTMERQKVQVNQKLKNLLFD